MKFEELGLSEEILHAINDMGFEETSPIQEAAIPVVMSGHDMIGQAQTGTGKTASFGIPVLEKVDANDSATQVLILSPTRELAIQSTAELHRLAKYMQGVKILPVYGGADMVRQIRGLKDGVHIVVGTPGRVMDHLRRKTISTEHIHTIVLDEADEMLNMGFREDIETILDQMPDERQVVLFSATMPKAIMDIADRYQHDARTVKIERTELTVPTIDQYYYDVRRKDKTEVLARLVDFYSPKLSVVFCNTKSMVDQLAEDLQARGYAAEALHGDMKQSARDRVMKKFREGTTEILIATDVAARGIDVDDVEAVFNYDVPREVEYYVHRIGRTGRAGRAGRAFTFVRGKEVYRLKDIQRYCKTKIVAQNVPSLADVQAAKVDQVMDKISDIIDEGGLSNLIDVVENTVNTSDYTAMDIAAAFLKQALEGEQGSGEALELKRDDRDDRRHDKRDHKHRDAHDGHDGRGERGECKRSKKKRDHDEKRAAKTAARSRRFDTDEVEEGMTRFRISLGKKHKIRPNDIVRVISTEAHIPGNVIGAIELRDEVSFVELPQDLSSRVLKSLKKAKFKGKKFGLELALKR